MSEPRDLLHGDAAARALHWYEPGSGQWLRLDGARGVWQGWSAEDGSAVDEPGLAADDRPWRQVLDDSRAPFYRWFVGGLTNACFNEIDRHVLAGRGGRTAILFEGEEWDDARGGPGRERAIDYRTLLYETVRAAEVLQSLDLRKGDRIALNMPNVPEQIVYTEAAKRLGIIYTPVFGGFSDKTLSDRIADSDARVVITCDSGRHNGAVVPYKSGFVDPALADFVRVRELLAALDLEDGGPAWSASPTARRVRRAVRDLCAGEITVRRREVVSRIDSLLAAASGEPAESREALRARMDRALAAAGHRVECVLVVEPGHHEVERNGAREPVLERATENVLARAGAGSEAALLARDDRDLWRALAASSRAEPVEADWPLFIIYTSGSTGKPKGVVHVHGGWLAGLLRTMEVVFDVRPDDRIYTVADPGWITGQSYLIAAPLAAGITSVQVEGSPLYPRKTRFASVIGRHRVTLFKAGSTFLKSIMRDPSSAAELAALRAAGALDNLRVGTFCAEPVSPVVQQFARESLCDHYINSYWATEHGGIVLSCAWADRGRLRSDAKTWPLSWIDAEVRVPCPREESAAGHNWRAPEPEPSDGDADRRLGEKGELVITRPYPYLARTIWGDAERLGAPDWAGDLERFAEVYFRRWSDGLAYTQGDWARAYADGSFTLHGRSDDVIKVSGHRIGTEEIEGAILRDKLLSDSPVGNAVVVGGPHDVKGQTPVVFVIPARGRALTLEDKRRLNRLVRSEKGPVAVPSEDDYITVDELPETRSGKYVRRMLQALLENRDPGDASTLRNRDALRAIRLEVEAWRKGKGSG